MKLTIRLPFNFKKGFISNLSLSNMSNMNKKSKIKVSTNNEFDTSKTKRQAKQVNSKAMYEHLISRIKAEGPMPIDKYMTTCLFHPEYGYYSSKENIFGDKGDFVTSPEISNAFGKTLSVWIYKQLEDFKLPAAYDLIELGPGKGSLACDIYASILKFKMDSGMTYYLIEKSAKLIKVQQDAIFKFVVSGKQNAKMSKVEPGDLNSYLSVSNVTLFINI